ncbi:hypothetical protein M438DRAFT_403144, partial [Aureobasidium pullulans EXF-150]
MSLTGLPSDILVQVINTISPDDIVAFSSINRRFYSLSTKRLAEHRALQEQYSKVVFDDVFDVESSISHPIKLLYDIWKNPRVASYVRHIIFICSDNYATQDFSFEPSNVDRSTWDIIERLGGCKDLLQTTLYFRQHADDLEKCRTDIQSGKQTAALTLLLVLLPNLQRLRYTRAQETDVALLSSIFTSSVASGVNPEVLSKLHTVETYHLDSEGMTWINMLLLFAELPSVRTLKGAHTGWSEDIDSIPGWKGHISHLQKLELSAGTIEPEDMESMLLPLQGLTDFRYHHACCGNTFEAQIFVDVLATTMGDQLEVLSLTNDEEDSDMTTRIASFKAFKRLKRLEVCIQALIDNAMDDTMAPRLLDLLPVTIESVALLPNRCERLPLCQDLQVQLLLRDIISDKQKCVPNLSTLVLYNVPDAQYVATLRDVGIVVERMDTGSLPQH